MAVYPGFSTAAMDEIWNDDARVAAMVDVEVAVALAQGQAGDIPNHAATAIAALAGAPVPATILAEGWQAGTPVLPLLDSLRARLDPDVAIHLHHALTTQDIIDSATMTLIRAAIDELHGLADDCAVAIRAADERDGARPTSARSFLQPADDTTFSARFARWVDMLESETMRVLRFPVQLGGLVGERRGMSDEVVRLTAAGLELDDAPRAWHSDRTPIVDAVHHAVRLARWAEQVGGDLALLSAFGEVRTRGGGSSAAAGKQNPIDSMRAMAAGEACAGVASTVLHAKPIELERGLGAWHAEWFAVPLVFMTAAAAMEAIGAALASLEVLT